MAVDEGRYSIDPGAVAELLGAFWGPTGWRTGVGGIAALPRKALDAGLVFAEPRRLDHDGWVAAARAVRARVRLEDVSNAFVASLGTSRRDLRSAISSWSLLMQLPDHAPDPWDGGWMCGLCGLPLTDEETDLNVMSFERFQWGGVRHDDVQYATFDLEMFLRAPRADLDSRAVELGRSLIRRLRSASANATVASLSRSAGLPESNAARRESLLAVLGVCGVLAAPDRPGFATTFVPYRDRRTARPAGVTSPTRPAGGEVSSASTRQRQHDSCPSSRADPRSALDRALGVRANASVRGRAGDSGEAGSGRRWPATTRCEERHGNDNLSRK